MNCQVDIENRICRFEGNFQTENLNIFQLMFISACGQRVLTLFLVQIFLGLVLNIGEVEKFF